MLNATDENYNPNIFDDLTDDELDGFVLNGDSDSFIDSIERMLCENSSSTCSDSFCEPIDYSQYSSSDIPLNRKEWLVHDPVSHRQRYPRLLEFLILLLDKSHYQSYASFVDRSRGIFQVHQPARVAELWQAVKTRQSSQKMTYDKFARAIRWYYKSNIMQKTNTRYTFQFSSETLKNFFSQ